MGTVRFIICLSSEQLLLDNAGLEEALLKGDVHPKEAERILFGEVESHSIYKV